MWNAFVVSLPSGSNPSSNVVNNSLDLLKCTELLFDDCGAITQWQG